MKQLVEPQIPGNIPTLLFAATTFHILQYAGRMFRVIKIKQHYLKPYKRKMAGMTKVETEFLNDLAYNAAIYDYDNKVQDNPWTRKVGNK